MGWDLTDRWGELKTRGPSGVGVLGLFDAAGPEEEDDDEGDEEGGLPEEGGLEGFVFGCALLLEAGDGSGEAEGGESVAEVEDESFDGEDGGALGGVGEMVELA